MRLVTRAMMAMEGHGCGAAGASDPENQEDQPDDEGQPTRGTVQTKTPHAMKLNRRTEARQRRALESLPLCDQ